MPPVDGLHRLLARRRPAERRRSPSSRPAARPGTTRSRSSSRCAACRCPWCASSSRPRRSFAPTRSRCRPRRAPRRAPAPPAGSPPSSPRRGSAPARRRRGCERSPDAGARSVEAFRQLITALRLFQAGGVGLGPYAWTRAGARSLAADRDRRRPAAARRLPARRGRARRADRPLARARLPLDAVRAPAQDGPACRARVARAISRFEAGLERNVVLEALNDYLLALRFVLEGGGPADLGLAMRVAALCAEPEQRAEIKAIVDRGARARARAVERRAGSRGRGRSDGGRDRGGDRGPDARDPQGRRLRPPGRRPARDRRRDPARRRARRGRGRGRAAAGAPRNGTCRPTSRTPPRGARGGRLPSSDERRSERGRAEPEDDPGRAPPSDGSEQDDGAEPAAGPRRAAVDGRLRRLAGGRRGP